MTEWPKATIIRAIWKPDDGPHLDGWFERFAHYYIHVQTGTIVTQGKGRFINVEQFVKQWAIERNLTYFIERAKQETRQELENK